MDLCSALIWADLWLGDADLQGWTESLFGSALWGMLEYAFRKRLSLSWWLYSTGQQCLALLPVLSISVWGWPENLSSKLEISFATVRTSSFKRQSTFKARRDHTFIWSDLWFTSSHWTWPKYADSCWTGDAML